MSALGDGAVLFQRRYDLRAPVTSTDRVRSMLELFYFKGMLKADFIFQTFTRRTNHEVILKLAGVCSWCSPRPSCPSSRLFHSLFPVHFLRHSNLQLQCLPLFLCAIPNSVGSATPSPSRSLPLTLSIVLQFVGISMVGTRKTTKGCAR